MKYIITKTSTSFEGVLNEPEEYKEYELVKTHLTDIEIIAIWKVEEE